MKVLKASTVLLALGFTTLSVASLAADPIDLGKREFQANCVVCHGPLGKGDGPYAGIVSRRVADLTQLSKNNGGIFPMSRIYASIEGAELPLGHGVPDMPIWGTSYRIHAANYYMDMPYDQDAFVRARILALAEYVSRLQVK